MRYYSPDKSDNPELLGKNYLQIGRHTLKRLKPLFTDDPFLYTNPIRTVSVEFLSTTQNNQRFLDFATKPEYQEYFDEETRQTFKGFYEQLQSRLGEFVFLFNTPVSIEQLDTIYEYPKNLESLLMKDVEVQPSNFY